MSSRKAAPPSPNASSSTRFSVKSEMVGQAIGGDGDGEEGEEEIGLAAMTNDADSNSRNAQITSPSAESVMSSWPDINNDSSMVESMVDPSFPSLFGTGANTSATSSRGNSQSASPFARSNGLGTPPPYKLRKLRETSAQDDDGDDVASVDIADIVLVKCPVPSEVMARWPCKDWSSKLFMTLLYQCVADSLSLSYFVMQFVSFNHPCSMWTNETPLEASVRQRLSRHDKKDVDALVQKTLKDFFSDVAAKAAAASSSSLPSSNSKADATKKQLVGRVRSYMLSLFGKHVSFKEAFAFALGAMSSQSSEKHDLNVSGLADYILDDMSWFVHFPIFANPAVTTEDTFSLKVFSFYVKGVIDTASRSFRLHDGLVKTEESDENGGTGDSALLSMGLILFFSVWSMHTNFSSEPSRMKLLWTTVCQLQSSAGFTFKCALTRPSVLVMMLVQAWRAFVLQLMRTRRGEDIDDSLRSDCIRALAIFVNIDMNIPPVDKLVAGIEKFYVWLCERLVKNVSKWCRLSDDLASIPLDKFDDAADGSASTFVKSLVVSRRAMVRIGQIVGLS